MERNEGARRQEKLTQPCEQLLSAASHANWAVSERARGDPEQILIVPRPQEIHGALPLVEGRWGNVPRHALETVAVEGYRTGASSEAQLRRLLGYEARFQVHALLKERGVPLRYTNADFEADLAAHRELGLLTR